MIRTLYILGLLLSIACPSVWAQLAQSLRLEIPSDPNKPEAFDVTPLGERGLLMTVRTDGFYNSSPVTMNFQRYDTNLKELWTKSFKQDIKFKPVMTYNTDQYVYHLFREYDSSVFQFVRLNLDDGATETFEGSLIDQFDVQQFKVMGSQAYVGGYRNGRPVVIAFSFFDHSVKVLPACTLTGWK